ncbi:MAG: zinc ribbon domain-containing protein [Lentisphaeria bacterium]|nr:zinc ribbon domain-containing protein [Lentisphaeria bacterium]
MPIFEYLCPACNRVFSFYVRNLSERKEPSCPKCGGGNLRRRFSRFAVTGVQRKSRDTAAPAAEGAPAGDAGGGAPDPMEDPRVEREMMRLMGEAENIDENDPRQLGRLMRRMTDITGEPVEPEMEEAMRRLEAGEDPEKIEEDLGDVLGDDAGGPGGGGPSYDDGLYDM